MAVTTNKITRGEYLNLEQRRMVVKALYALEDSTLRGLTVKESQEMLTELMDWFSHSKQVHVRFDTIHSRRKP